VTIHTSTTQRTCEPTVKQIQIIKRKDAHGRDRADVDLRTPSGRFLPF
jgi:hypothetical protein